MRISQLENLTNDELNLLLYIVNVIEPVCCPKIEFEKNQLLWFKHQALLTKVLQQESKIMDEGKVVFKSLIEKLNKHPIEECKEYEDSTKPLFTQSEFQF